MRWQRPPVGQYTKTRSQHSGLVGLDNISDAVVHIYLEELDNIQLKKINLIHFITGEIKKSNLSISISLPKKIQLQVFSIFFM